MNEDNADALDEVFRNMNANFPWKAKAAPSPNADLPASTKGRVLFNTSDETFYAILANGSIIGHTIFTTPDKTEALFAGSVAGLCEQPDAAKNLPNERREAIKAAVESKLPAAHRINGEKFCDSSTIPKAPSGAESRFL